MFTDNNKKKIDRAYHNQTAITYDSQITSVYNIYHKLNLRPWVKRLPSSVENSLALDIGTGTGVAAFELAKRCQRIIALDHSIGMVKLAQEKAKRNGLDNQIQFIVADCHYLPFADQIFMTVTIQGVLHHFGSVDMKSTLREIARILTYRGFLYVSEPIIEVNPIGKVLDLIFKVIGIALRPRGLFWKIANRINNIFSIKKDSNVQTELDEGPIDSDEILKLLNEYEIETSCSYVKHIHPAAYLPEKARICLTRAVSKTSSSKGCDIIFIYGEKRPEISLRS